MKVKVIGQKKHFETVKEFLDKVVNEEVSRLPYDKKVGYLQDRIYPHIKLLEGYLASLYAIEHFSKEVGPIIVNEDIYNFFNDHNFDACFFTTKFIKYVDKGCNKINWKMYQPTGIYQEVSLSKNHVDKYIQENISVIFTIRNSSDPNYYSPIGKMWYPDGKITVDGFQFYLLSYKNMLEGKRKDHGNYYYKVQSNGIMTNLGLRLKNQQTDLDEYKKKDDKSF